MSDLFRTSQAVGRTVTLLLVPRGTAPPLGPAWAVLCGACAAGNWQWQNGNALAALVLAIFIQVLWGTWRTLLLDVDWGKLFAAASRPGSSRALKPPYTTPWSPLGRLIRLGDRARHVMDEDLPAEVHGAVFTFPIIPPLILLLSAVVGWQMSVLSLAALALSSIEWRVVRHRGTGDALQAGLQILLAWLAGHVTQGDLTWISLLLACCYAIAYQGLLSLHRPRSTAWSLALLYGGQATAIATLILLQHPLQATLAGTLIAPQLLLLSSQDATRPARWYLERAVPFLMVAMPIAAWAA